MTTYFGLKKQKKSTRFILTFERGSLLLERGGVGVYFPLRFPLHPRPLKPHFPEPDPDREPGGRHWQLFGRSCCPHRRHPKVRRSTMGAPSGVEPSGWEGPAAALRAVRVDVLLGYLVRAGDPALSAYRFWAGGGDGLGGGRFARGFARRNSFSSSISNPSKFFSSSSCRAGRQVAKSSHPG